MLNVEHFRAGIIRPTLEYLGMWSPAAENLVLGTAIKESSLRHLKQLGGGPALGLYQMEPATHDDHWALYLHRKPALANSIRALLSPCPGRLDQLVTNLAYATALCRVHYWRRPEPLPNANDADGHGVYWKAHYNTASGAGVAVDFAREFRKYVLA